MSYVNRPYEHVNFHDCIRNFFSSETLQGDNAYFCEKCKKKQTARKRESIENPPNIMIIQFNRFKLVQRVQGKLGNIIDFPEHFSLTDFMSTTIDEKRKYTDSASSKQWH